MTGICRACWWCLVMAWRGNGVAVIMVIHGFRFLMAASTVAFCILCYLYVPFLPCLCTGSRTESLGVFATYPVVCCIAQPSLMPHIWHSARFVRKWISPASALNAVVAAALAIATMVSAFIFALQIEMDGLPLDAVQGQLVRLMTRLMAAVCSMAAFVSTSVILPLTMAFPPTTVDPDDAGRERGAAGATRHEPRRASRGA